MTLVKEYKRESKSPWPDKRAILIMANINGDNCQSINYERYIYIHYSATGVVHGLSVSKELANEMGFNSQYIEQDDMTIVFLLYAEEIIKFCERFRQEFTALYMLTPHAFFTTIVDTAISEIDN